MTAITFRPRAQPLPAVAVAAFGDAARTLARKVLARGAQGLSGIAGPDHLVLVGAELPWADGAIFLGTDPGAAGLHFPTWLEPAVHPALLARALVAAGHTGPVAVVPSRRLVIPLGDARPVSVARLEAWLQ